MSWPNTPLRGEVSQTLGSIRGATTPSIVSGNQMFAKTVRSIWVGTGGNIEVVWLDGATTLFTNVPGGAWFDVECAGYVVATTTATGLVGGL